MVTLTANEALPALLRQVREKAEIRDANGELLGFFTPRVASEDELYESTKNLFDSEGEIDRRLAAEKDHGFTIEQVMEHLSSLETRK
jgi:hypothetical protein